MSASDASAWLRRGLLTLEIEQSALGQLAARLRADPEPFLAAVALILQSPGRVILTGIGKSGHIARKIAATLASTGTPAYFVHAAEAAHGDLGMITAKDVVVALSYSGTSDELVNILPAIKRHGVHLIAITGGSDSALARAAEVVLDVQVSSEACPHNLAPTASTTAMLALGDALAMALLEARGFGPEDFARTHPGGALGRRLLLRVADVMRPAERCPVARAETPLTEVLLVMTQGGLGMVILVNEAQKPIGIFTDGDLRRLLERRPTGWERLTFGAVAKPNPVTIASKELAATAALYMEERRINQLIAVDEYGTLAGALNMHDLMHAKVI